MFTKFTKNINITLLIAFFVFTIFWIKGLCVLDPDFGWRMRAGIIYLQNGIPSTDPFTYTMPSFPWVDHAWIVSLMVGNLYAPIGKMGLSLVFSIVAFASILISFSMSKINTNKYFEKKSIFRKNVSSKLWMFLTLPSIIFIGTLFPYFSVRAQVVTWLFLALFLKVILDEKLWNKWKLAVPPFFLIWANFHGGFASGLAAFFLILFVRTIVNRKLDLSSFLIFISSAAFTLINPYGIGSWREVYSSISDSSLRWSIVEWMPAVFNLNFSFIALSSLSFVLIVKNRNKYVFEELVLYFVLLLNAFSTSRHVPLWAIVAAPMTSRAIEYFHKSIEKDKVAKKRFRIVYKYAFAFFGFVVFLQIGMTMYKSLIIYEGNFYPKDAIAFLSKNQPKGEMFSEYGWGGYLIWKYPEKKVFIDGRMPSWRRDNAPIGESLNAFEEYTDLLAGENDYKEVFDKYGVDTVLWPKEKPQGSFDTLKEKIGNFIKEKRGEEGSFNFINQLSNDGWELLYEDDISTIFQKQS